MNLLSERLKWAMEEKAKRDGVEVIPADIARAAGVSDTSASHWINNTNGISAAKARLVAEYLGVNPIWLENGTGAKQIKIGAHDESSNVVSIKHKRDDVEIRQYKDVAGSMGHGVFLRDQPGEIQSWTVSAEWIRKNIPNHTGIENLAIVTGFGPSMRGMFNPGDPLLVDRGVRDVKQDAVFFFRIGDEGFIKILQRVPGVGIRAISKNKEFETWTITPDMDFEVFAKVLKVWQSEDL